MQGYYILTHDKAEELMKEVRKSGHYTHSPFRLISDMHLNGIDRDRVIQKLRDMNICDMVDHIGKPRTRMDIDIPFSENYPDLVVREISERIGEVPVKVDEFTGEKGFVRITNITLRNMVWQIAYRHECLFSVEWGGDMTSHVWNILSYGWSNYHKGNWTMCMNPGLAAEMFLILDDMAGYLHEELVGTYGKVRKSLMCRQVEMSVVEAALKDAGISDYELYIASTRTIRLTFRSEDDKTVDLVLHSRDINKIHSIIDLMLLVS